MRLAVTVILLFAAVTGVRAGQYQITYAQQIVGAEHYTVIDPLVDAEHRLAGFVFADSAGDVLHISLFDRDTVVVVPFPDSITAVASYIPKHGDSVVVYALYGMTFYGPYIARLVLTGDTVTMYSDTTECYYDRDAHSIDFSKQRLVLERTDDSVTGLLVEVLSRYNGYLFTHGPWAENYSSALLYRPDLSAIIAKEPVTSIRWGNLFGDSTRESFRTADYYYYYDYRDSWDDPNWRLDWGTVAQLTDADGNAVLRRKTDAGVSWAVFTGRFLPGSQYEQVIYYGDAVDLLGLHGNLHRHVVCYDFSGDEPREVWYLPWAGGALNHVYEPQHYIAGLRGTYMVALDYWRGMITDSVNLDRTLRAPRFFETGDAPVVLNLVGRNHDTVFVYRFDTPTAVEDTGTPELLPSTIELLPGHPNPFNASTRITFSTSRNARLRLDIYNVLGQHITTLADGVFAPGTYSVEWRPDGQRMTTSASGIYFARLVSGTESRVTKLLLVK